MWDYNMGANNHVFRCIWPLAPLSSLSGRSSTVAVRIIVYSYIF